ncbi:uncharacterized protein LOC143283311 [Babylonia areolata]|uniref:uncharacterized protein LOC143283311 n=1 Tax=Babylonia areolata TaxID=304850 RepID=UPI003FCF1424
MFRRGQHGIILFITIIIIAIVAIHVQSLQHCQKRDDEDCDKENEKWEPAQTVSVAAAEDTGTAPREPPSGDPAAPQPPPPLRERTLVVVKPDGVRRGLVGEIVGRLERRGFTLVAAKLVRPGQDLIRQHYAELSGRGFFPDLLAYMGSGPVLAAVWEGRHVVRAVRAMLGPTDPLAAPPGTIRGDLAGTDVDSGNVCHASDSAESARREIGLWFAPEELLSSSRDHS